MTTDADAVNRARVKAMRSALTTLRRTWTGALLPHARQTDTVEQTQAEYGEMMQFLSDIEALMNERGAQHDVDPR
jgi:hypothetical protein